MRRLSSCLSWAAAGLLIALPHSAFAGDRERALEALTAGPPDLLLTDQRLPGMTGHELLVKVKGAHPDLVMVHW